MGCLVHSMIDIENQETYLTRLVERDDKDSYKELLVFYFKLFCFGVTFIAVNNYWNLGMDNRLLECIIYILLPGMMLMMTIGIYCR